MQNITVFLYSSLQVGIVTNNKQMSFLFVILDNFKF